MEALAPHTTRYTSASSRGMWGDCPLSSARTISGRKIITVRSARPSPPLLSRTYGVPFQASGILGFSPADLSFLSFAHPPGQMPVNHDRFSNSMPVVRGWVLVGAKECFLLAHFKVSFERLLCLRQAFNVLIFTKKFKIAPYPTWPSYVYGTVFLFFLSPSPTWGSRISPY